MSLHVLPDLLTLTLDDALPVVRAASRERQHGHDSGRDNENQDDGQDKNHCTLKHVFILPYPPLKSDKGTRS